ncbi:DnaJ C-terminal domain-containing protein [Hyphomicrobium sp. CS1BSMeth3]|uniref:DnaJ C-terminal domain-containing protein n=1 Tax=Hyphomicrobium sp. CS1BSMeth3 TaxID=1892844 RepID=UPI000930BF72|nr:DnaJ C-terminal domain-containing protein [Hyphomicrobium sp. CS1BSMeth3]
MSDDLYTVLGIARGAQDDEIRRAYRRLAKELHPDVRPDDPAASERFKRVTAAYDILGDATKRRRYDDGEIDAQGEPVRTYARNGAGAGGGWANGFGGRDTGVTDIFSDLFGARGTRGPGFSLRGQDVRYTLEVDFMEAVGGAKKRVTMPEGGTLDLTVPEGVSDGQVLRLKGKGAPGLRGGENGDALVEIHIRPHAKFKRIGNDILLELPITIDEAVLGGKIEVATISGRVALQIPKSTSSGRIFRLKGKGVRSATDGSVGDQLVTIRIVMPENVDESLSYFMAEWRQRNRYDPGRD